MEVLAVVLEVDLALAVPAVDILDLEDMEVGLEGKSVHGMAADLVEVTEADFTMELDDQAVLVVLVVTEEDSVVQVVQVNRAVTMVCQVGLVV